MHDQLRSKSVGVGEYVEHGVTIFSTSMYAAYRIGITGTVGRRSKHLQPGSEIYVTYTSPFQGNVIQ